MDRICRPQIVQGRIFIFLTILAMMTLICAEQLNADMYQWVDENGVKHFSNAPPANAENAKIVFDEHQQDKAADENRVKTDQKTIDALIEEIKKNEQQAKAILEKQKKFTSEEEKMKKKTTKNNAPFDEPLLLHMYALATQPRWQLTASIKCTVKIKVSHR